MVIYWLLDALMVSIVNIWWLMTFGSFFLLCCAVHVWLLLSARIFSTVNRKYSMHNIYFITKYTKMPTTKERPTHHHIYTHVQANVTVTRAWNVQKALTAKSSQTIRALKQTVTFVWFCKCWFRVYVYALHVPCVACIPEVWLFWSVCNFKSGCAYGNNGLEILCWFAGAASIAIKMLLIQFNSIVFVWLATGLLLFWIICRPCAFVFARKHKKCDGK